ARRAPARHAAAEAGLTIEVQGEGRSLATAKDIATGAGAVLALAILALTVGLIRSESAGAPPPLPAAGAASMLRPSLTATTAGALALLGALLGVAGAYVVLLAIYHDDLRHLSSVPLSSLAVAVVSLPLAASAAGCLLAGREPPTIARSVVEWPASVVGGSWVDVCAPDQPFSRRVSQRHTENEGWRREAVADRCQMRPNCIVWPTRPRAH